MQSADLGIGKNKAKQTIPSRPEANDVKGLYMNKRGTQRSR